MESESDKEIWDIESLGLKTQLSNPLNREGRKFDADKVVKGDIEQKDAPIAALQSIDIDNNKDQMSDLNSYQSQLSEGAKRSNNEVDIVQNNLLVKKKKVKHCRLLILILGHRKQFKLI